MSRLESNVSPRILGLTAALLLVCAAFAASAAQAASPAWRMLALTGPTNLPPVASEIQKVSVDATGGTFTLSFEAETTAPIAFDASAAEVQAALNALPSIGGTGGSVDVSGGPDEDSPPADYFIRFRDSLAGTDVASISADSSQLSGGSASAVVSTETVGGTPGEGTLAAYATNVGGAATVGTITLTVGPLPPGITTAASASGIGWSCLPAGSGQTTVTCTQSTPLAALDTAEPVQVPLAISSSAASESTVQVSIAGGGAVPDPAQRDISLVPIVVSEDEVEAGVQALWAETWDEDGNPATQAGSHPNAAGTMFMVNTNFAPSGVVVPAGDLRDVSVDLPPGFIGNPMVTERCPPTKIGGCGLDSFVGEAKPLVNFFPPAMPTSVGGQELISNDVPPAGYAAQFTIHIVDSLTSAFASLRSDEDFGVNVTAPNITPFYPVFGSVFVLEGLPADSHGKAFLTAATDCAHEAVVAPVTTISTRAWKVGSVFSGQSTEVPAVTGCAALDFEPAFTFQPGSKSAATGTAATAELSVDQARLLEPDQLAPPHLKKSVVTLPEGMTLNPAAANGLQACSTAQIGLKGTGFAEPNPIRFDKNPVTCPDGSKIGTVEVVSPLLESPLQGTVYLAAQDDNPFKSLLAIYLVIENERFGLTIKLPGQVTPNPTTGQLTATFDHNPQTPFSSLKVNFRGGGPRSTMATPDVCANYTTNGSFTPWSAPESGPPAATTNSFAVSSGVGGSAACPQTKAQRPFALGFEAGTTNPTAGAHSPFTLRITRPDGNQELDKVTVTTPPGFVASLKGVELCSEAQVAAAQAPGRDGKTEVQTPSCPASSQVGTTTIGAGVGSEPFYVKTGKVYLTGPYKGAPLGLAFVVPAVAGPFDLGVQVVRTALRVDPKTAQITAESDPIPQILEGIPLLIRDVRVDIDRPGFGLNPTNCSPLAVSGQVTGGSGAVANLSNRFQVGNCSALGFKPNLKIQLHGGTKRGDYQRVVATLTARAGDANISRAAVTFPHSAFLAQEHLDKICTRVQFAAKACPKGSIYGYARAITPLLDEPVQGPVYLRSNPEHELPDLVAALRGPDRMPIEVELQGRTDSKNEGIRNTFDIVPDVPVTKFTFEVKGGNHALIVNSRNLCKGKKQKANVRFDAQNGKVRKFQPVVKNDCGKKKGKKGGKKKGSANKRARSSAAQEWYLRAF